MVSQMMVQRFCNVEMERYSHKYYTSIEYYGSIGVTTYQCEQYRMEDGTFDFEKMTKQCLYNYALEEQADLIYPTMEAVKQWYAGWMFRANFENKILPVNSPRSVQQVRL